MKKIICIIISILIVTSFAACGDTEKTENSENPEASSVSKASEAVSDTGADNSGTEPASKPDDGEESSAPEQSSPNLCQDPEDFDYRVVSAHNAEEFVKKLKDLYEELTDDKADKFTAEEKDMLSPIGTILKDGYVFNPSYDGKYAVNEDPNATTSLKIEAVFWKDGIATVTYYCQNDDDIKAQLSVVYPNAEMAELIKKHGIEGQRMYNAGNEKPVSEYTAADVTALGCESVKLEKITFDGKQYDSLKYTGMKRDGTDSIMFMSENKLIIANFRYNNAELAETKNTDDIFETLKLEKVSIK